MALSGQFESSKDNIANVYLVDENGPRWCSFFYVKWSATQNINNNTSELTWTCYGGSDYNNTTSYVLAGPVVLTINGEIVLNRTDRFELKKDAVVGSGTLIIPHNNDGTKTVSVSLSAGIYRIDDPRCTYSGTFTLNTIPRASLIASAEDIILGNKCNIKWIPASSSFKYKIKFELENWNYTTDFISPATTSAYTYTGYTISGTTTANNTTIYAQLPKTTSGTMTATLTTYNSSGTVIGNNSSKTFTVSIPSSVVPSIGTITLDPVDIATVDGTSGNLLVRGKNKLAINVAGCAAGIGSTINSYTFSGPDIYYVGSSTSTSASYTSSDNISSAGTLTYSVKIKDARGRTAEKTATITCYDYETPSFKSFTAYRDGSNIKYSLSVDYPSVNSTNKSTVAIYYKKSSASSWTQAQNALTNSTTKSASAIIKNSGGTNVSFDSSTYEVYAIVKDNYGGSIDSSKITIFGEARIFNVRPNGTGIAFGKMAETDNLFECKWPAQFDDSVSFAKALPIESGGTGATTAANALKNLGVTATAVELNYCDGATSNIQEQLDSKAPYTTVNATTAATAGWYRIAQSKSGISNCTGIFQIIGSVPGRHTSATFLASTSYGRSDSTNIDVLQCSHFSTQAFTKARIVYNTTYSGNYAYLEIYNQDADAIPTTVKLIFSNNWTLVAPNTAGEIPSGYTSKEVTLTNNAIVTLGNGGTGAANGATGLKNLFAAGNTVLSSYQYGDALPSSGTEGQLFYLLDE